MIMTDMGQLITKRGTDSNLQTLDVIATYPGTNQELWRLMAVCNAAYPLSVESADGNPVPLKLLFTIQTYITNMPVMQVRQVRVITENDPYNHPVKRTAILTGGMWDRLVISYKMGDQPQWSYLDGDPRRLLVELKRGANHSRA